MKRTTVYLEEQMDLALSQIAKRRGRAKAELIREGLAALIHQEQQALSAEGVPSWVGAGDSGGVNDAEHDEDVLLELLEAEYEEILTSYDEQQKKAGR
jgi:predicted transcriptional regulator